MNDIFTSFKIVGNKVGPPHLKCLKTDASTTSKTCHFKVGKDFNTKMNETLLIRKIEGF